MSVQRNSENIQAFRVIMPLRILTEVGLKCEFSVIRQLGVRIVITESTCSRLTREKNINQIWLHFP